MLLLHTILSLTEQRAPLRPLLHFKKFVKTAVLAIAVVNLTLLLQSATYSLVSSYLTVCLPPFMAYLSVLGSN